MWKYSKVAKKRSMMELFFCRMEWTTWFLVIVFILSWLCKVWSFSLVYQYINLPTVVNYINCMMDVLGFQNRSIFDQIKMMNFEYCGWVKFWTLLIKNNKIVTKVNICWDDHIEMEYWILDVGITFGLWLGKR